MMETRTRRTGVGQATLYLNSQMQVYRVRHIHTHGDDHKSFRNAADARKYFAALTGGLV